MEQKETHTHGGKTIELLPAPEWVLTR